MIQSLPILSLLIWAPVLGGIFVLLISDRQRDSVKLFALVVSSLVFLLSTMLYWHFDATTVLMQFVEYSVWIDTFNINYHLGADGISVPLILLTTFTTVLVVIACWVVIETKLSQYLAAFLILEGLMIGVFVSLDAILFYFFWEAMLIPMFLIIGIWGGPQRVYATIKFFLYTFLGLGVHAGCPVVPVFEVGEFLRLRPVPAAAVAGRAEVDIHCFPARVCRENTHVAGAYLVARRARGSAYRRFGDPGRDPVEDGWLRLHPFQPAHHPGCQRLHG